MATKRLTANKYKKIRESHEAEREEWAMLIGIFMLEFGDIEHLVTLAIEFSTTEAVMKTVRQLQLSKRIELCKELLEANDTLTDEVRNPFLDDLKLAKKLSEKRNLIAHNPVRLTFRQREDNDELVAEGIISSPRNDKIEVTLEAMRHLAREAIKCNSLLNEHFSKVGYQLRGYHLKKPRLRKKVLPNPSHAESDLTNPAS
jgi:hypothetical protein